MMYIKPRTIWHKKTREIRKNDSAEIVVEFKDGTYMGIDTDYPLKECDFYEDMTRWCYLDDLINRYKKLSGDN